MRARRKKLRPVFSASVRLCFKTQGKQAIAKAVADQPQINSGQRQVTASRRQINAN
jgi:hypothetical protein